MISNRLIRMNLVNVFPSFRYVSTFGSSLAPAQLQEGENEGIPRPEANNFKRARRQKLELVTHRFHQFCHDLLTRE